MDVVLIEDFIARGFFLGFIYEVEVVIELDLMFFKFVEVA